MIRLLSIMAAAALALSTSGPALAQTATQADPETLAIAERVQASFANEQAMEMMLTAIVPLATNALMTELQRLPADRNPFAARLADEAGRKAFAQEFSSEFTTRFRTALPEVVKASAAELAKAMTRDDLTAIETFLKTTAGQKWLAVQPQIQTNLSKTGEAMGGRVGMETIQAMLTKQSSAKP